MNNLENIVSLCKRRGFIFPGSDVYGGMAGTWDFGPLGAMLKRKIMNAWWEYFVKKRNDMYGVDAAIIMNPRTWVASGHLATFIAYFYIIKKFLKIKLLNFKNYVYIKIEIYANIFYDTR